MGGIHLNFKVNPDLAIFGKALGSGFAINAIIGKRKIMRKSENTFISSTFGVKELVTQPLYLQSKNLKD